MGRTLQFAAALVAAAPAWGAAPPDFAHDVAPILYRACVECHHPGEAAPFSLLSYADAGKRAVQIAAVTRSRFMPPWLPDAGYGDFEGERRLTAAEIRTISAWAAAGAPEGSAEQAPEPPRFSGNWRLGEPELIVQVPSAFRVPASGPDIYWNFVLKAGIPSARHVR